MTVFKDCGEEGRGTLSFPQRGTSLALDVPIESVEKSKKMVDELNAFVRANGGRIYLAKDAFSSAEDFQAMYDRFPEWNEVRRHWDPHQQIQSHLSQRLMGDRPLEEK